MKLEDEGIIWINDTSMYVGSKKRYPTALDFLHAVVGHIKELIDQRSEAEMGWYRVPDLGDANNPYDHAAHVTTKWLVHRCSPFEDAIEVSLIYSSEQRRAECRSWWELQDEPGRGHTPVWCIDFDEQRRVEKYMVKRLKGGGNVA